MRQISGFCEDFYVEDRCVYKKSHSRKGQPNLTAPGFASVTVLGHVMDCLRNEYPYLRVLTHQLENYV